MGLLHGNKAQGLTKNWAQVQRAFSRFDKQRLWYDGSRNRNLYLARRLLVYCAILYTKSYMYALYID